MSTRNTTASLRPMLKLADGTWLVGDHADGSPLDWLQNDIALAEVRWLKLDIAGVDTKFIERRLMKNG